MKVNCTVRMGKRRSRVIVVIVLVIGGFKIVACIIIGIIKNEFIFTYPLYYHSHLPP